MKDLIEFYHQFSSEFEEELKQRTSDEVAYDNAVIKEPKKGETMKNALDIAAQSYPDEALQYTDENIDDIQAHYEFLLNHELIKSKIARLTN